MKVTRTLTSLRKERDATKTELTTKLRLYDEAIHILEKLNEQTFVVHAKSMDTAAPKAKAIAVPLPEGKRKYVYRHRVPTVCQNPDCPRGGKEFKAKKRSRKFCNRKCKDYYNKNVKRGKPTTETTTATTAGKAPNRQRGVTLIPGDNLSQR